MPQIFLKLFFSPLIKNELPEIAKNKLKFLIHPKTTNLYPGSINKNTVIAIGPEGGFVAREIESLENIGFKTVSLGKRILRTETAVPVIISRLMAS